jgi:hypothetical protein
MPKTRRPSNYPDIASELSQAVERMHGGKASFVQSVPVKETFDGKTESFQGTVHLQRILVEAQATVDAALASPS